MSLASLIATGTKVWLDGVEPGEIEKNRAWGITGRHLKSHHRLEDHRARALRRPNQRTDRARPYRRPDCMGTG